MRAPDPTEAVFFSVPQDGSVGMFENFSRIGLIRLAPLYELP